MRFPQPACDFVVDHVLPGDQQGQAAQVRRGDGRPGCQRRVLAHQDAPAVLDRQTEELVARKIHGLDEEAEIHQIPVYFFHDVLGVAAEDVEGHMRVILPHAARGPGDEAYGVGLAAADVDVTAQQLVRCLELRRGLFQQADDLLRPLAEKRTFLRQGDAPFAAQEKRLAQLFFQLLHLPGQGGLGHVQGLGGSGDGLCLRDRQKIAEGSQFHVMLLCRDAGWLMPAAGVTGRQGRSERAEDLRLWPHGLRSGYKKSPPGGAGNGRGTDRGDEAEAFCRCLCPCRKRTLPEKGYPGEGPRMARGLPLPETSLCGDGTYSSCRAAPRWG